MAWNEKTRQLAIDKHGADVFVKAGIKGGQSKVLKGMAKIAAKDPVRFQQIIKTREDKLREKRQQNG